jgi:hypothetical protein
MLCTTCQNRPHCVAAQLARSDAALDRLLGNLQRCGLWRRRSPWQRLWQHFWQRLGTILRPLRSPV